MKDVKALIRLDYSVLLGSSIYLIGFGLFCFFQKRRRELAMSFVWGSVLTIAIIIFLGLAVVIVLISAGFNSIDAEAGESLVAKEF